MLEIAILGIAIMLVVKGLDVLHQQSISKAGGAPGSKAIAIVAVVVALGGALLLLFLEVMQGRVTGGSSSVDAAQVLDENAIMANMEVAPDSSAGLASNMGTGVK